LAAALGLAAALQKRAATREVTLAAAAVAAVLETAQSTNGQAVAAVLEGKQLEF
jgi:hypothetical protein